MDLYNTGILLGVAFILIGLFSQLKQIKSHFRFTYQNFGLLIFFVLFSILSFGQTPSLIIKLTGPGVAFGENIPVGTILVDMTNNKEYLTLTPLPGSGKISDYLPVPPSLISTLIKEISNTDHSGDVSGTSSSTSLTIGANKVMTGMIKDGEVQTADIKDENVTYAKIQKISASKMLGNSTLVAAVPQEITIGTGISLSSGTLTSSAVSKFLFTNNYLSHGVYGNVTLSTSTPTLGITLDAIIPSSVTSPGIVAGSQLQANAGTGTPPLIVFSATEVPNLRAATAALATLATKADNLTGGSGGQILYQSGNGVTSKLMAGTVGQVLTSGGAGAPAWSFFPAYAVTILTDSSTPGTYEWDPSVAMNAVLELNEDVRVKLIVPTSGTSGNLTVLHGDNLTHELRLDGQVGTGYNRYAPSIKKTVIPRDQIVVTSSSSTLIDNYSWYYDGTYIFWTGTPGFVE